MNPIVRLVRKKESKIQCTGICTIEEFKKVIFTCFSIERGENNNQRMVSCIPKGVYELVYEYSYRFKSHLWEIKGVPNRSECKFHSANYAKELNGCIALGDRLLDINYDGNLDVVNSKKTMSRFENLLRGYNKATLIVE